MESFLHGIHLPIEKPCVQFQRGNADPEIKHAVTQREEPREAGLELSGNCREEPILENLSANDIIIIRDTQTHAKNERFLNSGHAFVEILDDTPFPSLE